MGATKSYTDFLQARTVPFVYVFVLPFPCFHCFQAVWWQQSPAEACRSSCWDGLEPPATGVPAARCGVTLLLPAAPTVPNPTPGRCLQTRLSLNGGGDWQPLSRPERFTNPQCNTCKPGAPDNQCRLHLHGPTSWFAPEGEGPLRLSLWLHVERAVPAQGGRHGCQGMDAVWRAVGGTHGQRFVGHGGQRAGRCPYQRPSAQRALGAASRRAHPCLLCVPPLVCMHGPSSLVPPPPAGPRPNFYSHEATPGLVIATGNVGPHLDFKSGATCTYLSRDAGLSWEDVADYVGGFSRSCSSGSQCCRPCRAPAAQALWAQRGRCRQRREEGGRGGCCSGRSSCVGPGPRRHCRACSVLMPSCRPAAAWAQPSRPRGLQSCHAWCPTRFARSPCRHL